MLARSLLLACFLLVPSIASGLSGKLVLTGSSTVAPLMADISKEFESLHKDVRIDVQSGGSSRGIADISKGLTNIGMISRQLYPNEQGLKSHLIAQDGIAMILHASNKTAALTDEQIKAIYRGEITDWQQLNAAPGGIVVVQKATGRSTLELFMKHFGLKNREVKPSLIIGDNQQGLKTVAGNPLAIGYVSIGAAEYAISAGESIKMLPLGSVQPSVESLSHGRFPLSRPLNLITKGQLSPLETAFIDFARSAAAEPIIKRHYFAIAAKR